LLAAAGALLLAAAPGCGEREFEDAELVEELNAAGAGLQLGEPLPVGTDDIEVRSIAFEHTSLTGDSHTHASGAISILPDSEAALSEFERCEGTVDFTCFRVANAVLRFTGLEPADHARLTEALRSLET
jgi:hypothetical protein